ncbi:hypothetical protein AAFF_G00411330 [Aldrovandia affinis]|uniref:Uncharacterized protein n=1 Tax=Aldrovandia affinis TaxID=143900 RepID=A0AAD7SB87_9TELE|nr:hypothetical protein AAFF_G00411330 [Aldrovandia affinis]
MHRRRAHPVLRLFGQSPHSQWHISTDILPSVPSLLDREIRLVHFEERVSLCDAMAALESDNSDVATSQKQPHIPTEVARYPTSSGETGVGPSLMTSMTMSSPSVIAQSVRETPWQPLRI